MKSTETTVLGSLPLTYTEDDGYTSAVATCTVDGQEISFMLTLRGNKVDFYAWNYDGDNFHANGLSPALNVAQAWKLV